MVVQMMSVIARLRFWMASTSMNCAMVKHLKSKKMIIISMKVRSKLVLRKRKN